MRLLVLQHEVVSGPALLEDWAAARGHALEVVDVPALVEWPNLMEYSAVVTLGSDFSVHADSAIGWIDAELVYLRHAHGLDVPLLGICFGGQALAKALGGAVRRAGSVSVGWMPITNPRSEFLGDGPWFRWHEDVFSVPPGGTELARSEVGSLAFSLNRSIGLQIHPEVTAAEVEVWIAGAREQLGEEGVDEDQLREEISVGAPEARDRAFNLFDRIECFWQDASSPGRPPAA